MATRTDGDRMEYGRIRMERRMREMRIRRRMTRSSSSSWRMRM